MALDWNPEPTAPAAQRSSGRSTQVAAIRRGGGGAAVIPCCPFVLPGVPGPWTAEDCGNGKALAGPDVRPSSMLVGSCRGFPNPQRQPGGAPAWLRVLPRWPLGPQLRTQSQHAPFVPDECPQQGRSVGSHPKGPSRPNSPLGWGRAGLLGCCLEPQPGPPCMASHWRGSLGPGRPLRPPSHPISHTAEQARGG